MIGAATISSAMLGLAVRLSSATPTSKDLTDPVDVSPGLIGFLATFAIVLVTVLLIIDMNRRVRRLRYRQRQAEAADRAAEAQRAPGSGAPADDTTPGEKP